MSRLAVRCDPQTDVAADEVQRLVGLRPMRLVTLENSDALPFADSLHASGEPV